MWFDDNDLPEEAVTNAVLDVSVSLDHIPSRHLPPILKRPGGRLMIQFGNLCLWIRRDQAEELAAKLIVAATKDTDLTASSSWELKEKA